MMVLLSPGDIMHLVASRLFSTNKKRTSANSEEMDVKPTGFAFLGGRFNFCLIFTPIWGRTQIDQYVSNSLKPPTSLIVLHFVYPVIFGEMYFPTE